MKMWNPAQVRRAGLEVEVSEVRFYFLELDLDSFPLAGFVFSLLLRWLEVVKGWLSRKLLYLRLDLFIF